MRKKSKMMSEHSRPERSPLVLDRSFFDRPTCQVAEELIGKYLVRRIGSKNVPAMITETEAYDGPNDEACHAHRGMTPRNAPMFGAAGHWYVYFVYGMHWMLNIVTGPKQYPAAVLIRGVTLEDGTVLDGPAKLTKYLQINRTLNDSMTSKETGLWIEDRGILIDRMRIKRKPRIGVGYAGAWAEKEWRYVYKEVDN
ncbi:MAG: DNA-3-methyladenine glycosylase [Candidatus Peribacteraceae bacterium]|nr:DNA-3-methyladenine glycosylase [Candidatus Peribacteraceae bacterium]